MNKPLLLPNLVGFAFCGLLGLALAGCTVYEVQPRPVVRYVAPPPLPVAGEVESPFVNIRVESDFYEPLRPYGRWEVVGSYGRCWIPNNVHAEWKPYCDGSWRRTDAGWYWASNEPWGWATYHYGRWDWNEQFGWYWVPQTQWAPAWVSWQEGGGYVGWAPLHPSVRFGVIAAVDVNLTLIAPRAYVFVEERQFLQPVRPTTVIVNNTTIINKTVNITNIKVVNKTVINEGPRTSVIERASGHKIQAVPVRELRRKQEATVAARQPVASPGPQKPTPPPPVQRKANAKPANESRQIAKPAAATKPGEKKTNKKSPEEKKHADEQAQREAERRAKEEQAAPR